MMATAFMTTASQLRYRRSSDLFLTLATNHLLRLAVVVLMTMVFLTASAGADTFAREEVGQLAQVDGVTYIHGCSDLVNDRTAVHGYVCFVRDVNCDETKVCVRVAATAITAAVWSCDELVLLRIFAPRLCVCVCVLLLSLTCASLLLRSFPGSFPGVRRPLLLPAESAHIHRTPYACTRWVVFGRIITASRPRCGAD